MLSSAGNELSGQRAWEVLPLHLLCTGGLRVDGCRLALLDSDILILVHGGIGDVWQGAWN